jgi:hypothetical protein
VAHPILWASAQQNFIELCSITLKKNKTTLLAATAAAASCSVYLYLHNDKRHAQNTPSTQHTINTALVIPKASQSVAPTNTQLIEKKIDTETTQAPEPATLTPAVTAVPPIEIRRPLMVQPDNHQQAKKIFEESANASVQSPVAASSNKTIQFTSAINDNKKGYNLVFMTYRPSKFKVSINGQELADNSSIHIPIVNDEFIIRYDYLFSLIKDPGFREVKFRLKPGRVACTVDFSFMHETRFIIDHADFVEVVALFEPGSQYAPKK